MTHIIPGAFLWLLLLLILRSYIPKALARIFSVLALLLVLALTLLSFPPVSNYFVSKLEFRYPVLQQAPPDTALIQVLAYGHIYKDNVPNNSLLMAIALSRVSEGVRLWKTNPDAYLALSGAPFQSPITHAEAQRRWAVELGVPDDKIVLFDQTRDTEAEITASVQLLGGAQGHTQIRTVSGDELALSGKRIVLTSSAIHLPRAAMILEKHNAQYTMAPTDFLVLEAPWYRADAYFLNNMDRVLHEWVGMLWYRFRPVL